MLGNEPLMEAGPPKSVPVIGGQALMEGGVTQQPMPTAFSQPGLNFVDALADLPESKLKPAKQLLLAKDAGDIGGLLASPEGKFGGIKSILALIAELLGTLVFSFAASTTPSGTRQQQGAGQQPVNWTPWGNGITLVITVFLTANISGGHLNPAVTLGTMLTGHINILLGAAYMVAQVVGATLGLLLVAGLVPGADIGMGDSGPGCFHRGNGISKQQLFAWELVMTWVLVSVVYAVAIGKPSYGNAAPLAVGLTLFAMAFAGGSFTGSAINPARALAPAFVFRCYMHEIWIYVLAELTGGAIAGMMAGPLYGVRAKWLKQRLPEFLNLGMADAAENSRPRHRARKARITELERQLTGSLDQHDVEKGPRTSHLTARPARPSVDAIPEGKPL